jgi:hypothetical protein
MRRWVLAIGLIFIFLGSVLWLRSTVVEEKPNIIWNEAKTVIDALEISANFTAGDKVALRASPNYEWKQEPGTEDTNYLPSTYVFINITDPKGNASQYELAFVKQSLSLSLYKIYLRIPGGFSGEYGNEMLKNEGAIVGKVLYNGEYKAKVWGVMPPPGGIIPPSSLSYQKEVTSTVTEHPYSNYIYAVYAMFILGAIVAAFSFIVSPRKTSSKARRQRAK